MPAKQSYRKQKDIMGIFERPNPQKISTQETLNKPVLLGLSFIFES
jgi:hypothetical protein